jgi:chemotaxis protein MotB
MMDEQDPFATDSGASQSKSTWLVMFTDLLSLLLTFFVLMFSMNAVQMENWKAVVGTLSDRLNPDHMLVSDKTWGGRPVTSKIDLPLSLKLEYLGTVISQKLADDPIFRQSRVQVLDGRLIISLPSDILFQKDSAVLRDAAAMHVLEALGNILRNVPNQVGVVGHAEPAPAADEDLPSNWELSLIRAIAASRVLQDSGFGRSIVTFGNGDARLEDLGVELSFEEKSRLARRIDIIVGEDDDKGWSE